MRVAVTKFSRNHEHLYRYDARTMMWCRIACRIRGGLDRCTASGGTEPRGTKFDSYRDIDPDEVAELEDAYANWETMYPM